MKVTARWKWLWQDGGYNRPRNAISRELNSSFHDMTDASTMARIICESTAIAIQLNLNRSYCNRKKHKHKLTNCKRIFWPFAVFAYLYLHPGLHLSVTLILASRPQKHSSRMSVHISMLNSVIYDPDSTRRKNQRMRKLLKTVLQTENIFKGKPLYLEDIRTTLHLTQDYFMKHLLH
jgi:hypothetical protein